MIEIENVFIKYENIVAVNNVSLNIKNEALLGIVGPNGAGKSTLIKAMVGLISDYSGEIYYNNLQLKKNRFEIKKIVGYAPEDVDLLPYLSGVEYLNMIAEIRNVVDTESQINHVIEILNLENKQYELINEYSHGMKQKLSVAGALIGSPKVLIFDEALNGFDPVSLYNIKAEIEKHVKGGGTVIISSHILELIEKWCSQIVIMNKGRIMVNYNKNDIEKLKQKNGIDFNDIFVKLIQGEIK